MKRDMDELFARASEEVARQADRRQFLTRAFGAVFTVVAGGALFSPRAFAHTNDPTKGHCFYQSGSSSCSPPNGTYCTGCNGHQCPNNYAWTAHWYPNTACWCTTPVSGHYKVCCDCVKVGKPWSDPSACGCYSTV